MKLNPLLYDLFDIFLSEFEGRTFTLEEALDYVAPGEEELIQELVRSGLIEEQEEGILMISDAENFYKSYPGIENYASEKREQDHISSGMEKGRIVELTMQMCPTCP